MSVAIRMQKNWPKVNSKDAASFRKFFNFLAKFQSPSSSRILGRII